MKLTFSVIKADIGSISGHIGYFDGPPAVSCAAYSSHGGNLSEPEDCFAHPFWDTVRDRVAGKAIEMRRQGFFGAAMLPMSELEYTGITQKLEQLDGRFKVRGVSRPRASADAQRKDTEKV
jgi:fructose 1,6-bisphosphate aldolase/phosphatase